MILQRRHLLLLPLNQMMPNQLYFTNHHIGIILTVIGTGFLAFSVRITRQYQGEMSKIADKLKRGASFIEFTETTINRSLFWIGLGFVALGSALQW
jgi:hypothetical protein